MCKVLNAGDKNMASSRAMIVINDAKMASGTDMGAQRHQPEATMNKEEAMEACCRIVFFMLISLHITGVMVNENGKIASLL